MKPKMRFLSCLLALVLCLSTFALPAYAKGDDPNQNDYDVIVQTPEETRPKDTTTSSQSSRPTTSTEATEETEPPAPTIAVDGMPFTEDSIVATRDLLYDAATNKQYITVETRNGNTFYIVIDYDKPVDEDGEQYYTYFLNQVDEADLLALLGEEDTVAVCICADKCAVGTINTQCEICAVNMVECMGVEPTEPETEPPTEPVEEPEPGVGTGPVALVVVLIAALAGGGAYYFLKVKGKNKPQTKGSSDLDDYDFGDEDDGEYAEFEQYDPASEQEGV